MGDVFYQKQGTRTAIVHYRGVLGFENMESLFPLFILVSFQTSFGFDTKADPFIIGVVVYLMFADKATRVRFAWIFTVDGFVQLFRSTAKVRIPGHVLRRWWDIFAMYQLHGSNYSPLWSSGELSSLTCDISVASHMDIYQGTVSPFQARRPPLILPLPSGPPRLAPSIPSSRPRHTLSRGAIRSKNADEIGNTHTHSWNLRF